MVIGMSHVVEYLTNNRPLSRVCPKEELTTCLHRLVRKFPPRALPSGGGFYYGPTSIAFLFFVLDKHYKSLKIHDVPLRGWCTLYLGKMPSNIPEVVNPIPDRCGIMEDGISSLAFAAASTKSPSAARKLCECLNVFRVADASNDWLHGRAGYLYLLRLVKASFADNPELLDLLRDTADAENNVS